MRYIRGKQFLVLADGIPKYILNSNLFVFGAIDL